MRLFSVIIQIAVLYIFSIAGSLIAQLLHLPLPGSLIGMLLLFSGLCLNVIRPTWIQKGSEILLRFMPVFFVPITVGVITFPSLLSINGFTYVLILFMTTVVMLLATAKISAAAEKGGKERV